MATTLTISTTLPNGSQVTSSLSWADDVKARRALTLFAQTRGGDTTGTPRQQLDFVVREIARYVRTEAVRQYQDAEAQGIRSAAEDEIGPEPT